MRAAVVGLIVIATCAIARADGPSEADETFSKAQQLRESGKTQEACAMFAQALRLNPNAIGTILNVARCAEESGRVATAIRRFTEARDRAREQNLDPQREAAEDHLAKLEGRAPHLAIAFAEKPTADTKLLVDDEVIDIATASDVAVDPGKTKIVVSAPNRVPYVVEVDVAEHGHQAIAIPKLALPVTSRNSRRAIGKALTVIGTSVLVGSGIIGIAAHHYWSATVHDHCREDPPGSNSWTCSEMYNEDARRDQTIGDAATWIAITGAAVAGAGLVLWLVVPSHDERAVAVVPMLSPQQAGLVASFRF